MKTKNLFINLGIVFSLLFCMAFACNDGDRKGGAATADDGTSKPGTGTALNGAPTEAEVKAAIEKNFNEVYGGYNGGAKVDKINIEFGQMRFGKKTLKQMFYGKDAEEVYPVQVPVDITLTYSNNPSSSHYERGKKTSETFLFYKDSFDEWAFKIGEP